MPGCVIFFMIIMKCVEIPPIGLRMSD